MPNFASDSVSPKLSLLTLLCGAGLLLISGCGGGSSDAHPVTGKVHNGADLLKVANAEIGVGKVEVIFYRVNDAGKADESDPMSAIADPATGEFSPGGPAGDGLPAGTYKVAVRQWDPYPSVDQLKGKFDAAHTPIELVVDGTKTIDIDLSQY